LFEPLGAIAPIELINAIKAISDCIYLLMEENLADDGNGTYEGELFTLKSFSVGDDGAALFTWHPNGEPCFEVTWWQHVGRGTYASDWIEPYDIAVILQACVNEVMEMYAEFKSKPESI
jgi:hypothetical protein